MESSWRDKPEEFEAGLVQSAANWSRVQNIPLALKVIMTKRDDAAFRRVVRKAAGEARMDSGEKAFLFLVPALWGDEWAQQHLMEDLNRRLEKAIRSNPPKLMDLTWSFRRAAMIQHWSDRTDLEELSRRFKSKVFYDEECMGMVETLLEVHEHGIPALAEKLALALAKRRVSEADIAACFVLGAVRSSDYRPLFLQLYRELGGNSFWNQGLRRCALASFAYRVLPHADVQKVIEERLVRLQKKLASWWFGSSRSSEFMNACDILWNVEEPLNAGIVSVLQAVAVSPAKWNAKEAITLLLLKGLKVPENAAFDCESFDIRCAKDSMQYDKILNFAYYWRCRDVRCQIER